MTAAAGKRIVGARIALQCLSLLLFFFLLFRAGAAVASGLGAAPLFFYLDPLLPAMLILSFQKVAPLFVLALVPLLLTFLLGRFFCGWACPLGAVHQLVTWLGRKRRGKERGVDRRALSTKYLLLVCLAVAALFGVQLAGWLDPITLMTRSSAAYLLPSGNSLLQHALQAGAGEKGVAAKALAPFYAFSRKHILTESQRVFAGALSVGLLFLVLVLLNLYRRRFFCNTLCPLGALYGLLSKFSPLRLRTTSACKGCNACAKNCTYGGSPYQDYLKSECLLCFNCVADCPVDAVGLGFSLPRRGLAPAVDLGRRALIGSLASGLALASFPHIAPVRKQRFHSFLRPPGSRDEKEFLDRCLRCGECLQACPTNALHPANLQAGLEGLWTPVLVPTSGYCEYECNRCTQVCPSKAIARLSLEEKKKFKVGTAVVNRSLCYTYVDGYNCAVCEEHCPVPDKAIKFRSVEVMNYRGRLRRVDQVYVDPRLCIGCGICEYVCPRTDTPAITVGAEEEQRESGGSR